MRRRGGRKHRYRDQITIQYDNSDDGSKDPVWKSFVSDVPCLVVDVTGQSSYRGVQLEETLSTVAEMHYVEGLKPDMRIQYGSRTLEIRFVKTFREGTAREKHWAFCNEVVV